jgi:predicted MFS family arabinose efflux permease
MLISATFFWHFHYRYQLVSQFILIFICLSLIWIKSFILFAAALFIIGILTASIYNDSLFYGSHGSSNRDERMAMHETILTIGNITGSIFGGLLFTFINMNAVYLLCTGVCLAIFIYKTVFFVVKHKALRLEKDKTEI